MGDVVGLTRDQIISIHAPREGGDRRKHTTMCCGVIFQSTPPARGATPFPDLEPLPAAHFNPRPPRGGRRYPAGTNIWRKLFQSTPPARGATVYFMAALLTSLGISIHAPREGGDQQNTHSQQQDRLFQSTPPARGATVKHIERRCYADHFNPRPPRGGRLKR